LGEYSALTAAECIGFSSAVSFVKFRAEAMQDAVPENGGGMAAVIGVTEECVEDICKSARENSKNKLGETANSETVEIANINSGKQIVISGSNSLLDIVTKKIVQLSNTARVVKLPVSAPFHSSLLAPAKIKLENRLNEIELNDPTIPVLSNVTAKPYKGINEIRELLPLQAISPVLWRSTVETMIRSGIETFVECGPGRVLSGLIKQIDRSVKIYNFKDYDSFTKAMESLND
jgi:[acyl-carrier-protein] S-malonyltransferase